MAGLVVGRKAPEYTQVLSDSSDVDSDAEKAAGCIDSDAETCDTIIPLRKIGRNGPYGPRASTETLSIMLRWFVNELLLEQESLCMLCHVTIWVSINTSTG